MTCCIGGPGCGAPNDEDCDGDSTPDANVGPSEGTTGYCPNNEGELEDVDAEDNESKADELDSFATALTAAFLFLVAAALGDVSF